MSEKKDKSTETLTHGERVKFLISGAIFHARAALQERDERLKSITGALREDKQAWELESVILEKAKWKFILIILQGLAEFIP